MVDLRAGDARITTSTVRQQLAETRDRTRLQGSSRAKLTRGQFGAGSIPPEALVAPAAPGVVSATTTGFGLSPDPVGVIQVDVTVPPAMRGCALNLTGRVYAVNGSVAGDHLLTWVTVEEAESTALPAYADAGLEVRNDAPAAVLLQDLAPGTTFVVTLWARTAVETWPAIEDNFADLNGFLGWFA